MQKCEFKPPKNLQYFLLILKELRNVRGRIKLFKIHYLIEKEGLIKYDRPIKNYPYGPVDYSSFDFCKANNLIEEELVTASPYDYYEISLTKEGKDYFDNCCLPLMSEKESEKAKKIIAKYRSMGSNTILKYVHEKYVDSFKDVRWTIKKTEDYLGTNSMILNLVQNRLKELAEDKERDQQYILLGQLHHVEKILQKLKYKKDPVNIGSVLWTVYELHQSLGASQYSNNPYAKELFEYLDNYCEKEGIHQSITSDDFSDLPEEERERLFQVTAQLEIPPSS